MSRLCCDRRSRRVFLADTCMGMTGMVLGAMLPGRADAVAVDVLEEGVGKSGTMEGVVGSRDAEVDRRARHRSRRVRCAAPRHSGSVRFP